MPDFIDQTPGMNYCKEHNGVSTYWVGDWDSEPILKAIEEVAAAFGAAFNGDKRLFAVEVGFVGFGGYWTQGLDNYQDNNAARKCPMPSDAAARRIIGSMTTAFSQTWVLMANPWNLPGFDYTPYTNLGILTFFPATNNYTQDLTEVGLQDRWKTAPVVGITNSLFEKCWWDADPSVSCAALGVSSDVPTFREALDQTKILTAYTPRTFIEYKNDNAAIEKARDEGYMMTGAMFHLSSVSLQVSGSSLRLCAQLNNIGSSPYYAMPQMAFKIWLNIHVDQYELRSSTPVNALLPGESVAYSAEVPWLANTDECSGNTICSNVGQGCIDDNTDPYSRGDWYCVCTNGAGKDFRERARPAVCRLTTAYQFDDLTWYSDQDNYTLITKNSSEMRLTNQSWAMSMWINLPRCMDKKKCASDEKYVWDADVLVGHLDKRTKYTGLALMYESRNLRSKFSSADCNPSGNNPYTQINGWTHVIFNYEQPTETMWIYENGVRIHNCTGIKPYLGEGFLAIGKRNETTYASTLFGWMKEFRVLNGVLDATDVARLYAPTPLLEIPVPAKIKLDTDFRLRDVAFASSHQNLTKEMLTISIPLDSPKTNEGCLTGGPTPNPTPVPWVTVAPPAHTDGCDNFTLSGFNATILTSGGEIPAGCDGEYFLEGPRWVNKDHTREIWRAPYDVYRCTLMGGSIDGPHLGTYDAAWWGEHLVCTVYSTPAPTPVPTPLPSGETYPPVTNPPDTALPSWSVTTKVPLTVAPNTAMPTGTPDTAAPATSSPATMPPTVPVTPSPVIPSTIAPGSPPGTTVSPTTSSPGGGGGGKETLSPGLGAGEDEGSSGGLKWWFYFLISIISVVLLVAAVVWFKVWKKKHDETSKMDRYKKQIAEGNGSRILDYPLVHNTAPSPLGPPAGEPNFHYSDPSPMNPVGQDASPAPEDTFVL